MESKKINGVSMMTEPAGGVFCILPDEMWTGDIQEQRICALCLNNNDPSQKHGLDIVI